MERRPIRSPAEVPIYVAQLARVRIQLRSLQADYERVGDVYRRVSLMTDIRLLQDVEFALLQSINTFLSTIGEPLVT